jgi:hypothetical protein
MPQDQNFYLVTGCFVIISLALISFVLLRGWRDWISLKHAELNRMLPQEKTAPSASSRIEVADLKERVKKLEAIASGIDI